MKPALRKLCVCAESRLFNPSANLCTMRTGNEDLYFFGHGVGKTNYRNALKDFSLIAGIYQFPELAYWVLLVKVGDWVTGTVIKTTSMGQLLTYQHGFLLIHLSWT